jgi:hypothetical protein
MDQTGKRFLSTDRRTLIAGVGALAISGAARTALAQEPSAATHAVLTALRAMAQPAVVLEQTGRPTVCRLGGGPRLPAPNAWPDRRGRPLSFLAELDLAALRKAGGPAWLPDSGFLHMFYDVEDEPWGFDPADRDGWKIVMTDTLAATSLPRPAGLSSDRVFRQVQLAGRSALTYPTTERLSLPAEVGEAFDFEPVQALQDSDLGDGPRHQVGGYPAPILGYGM